MSDFEPTLVVELDSFSIYDQETGQWTTEKFEDPTPRPRTSVKRRVAMATAAVVTAAAAIAGSGIGNSERAPHVGKLTPAAARTALLDGVSCSINGISPSYDFYNGDMHEERQALNLNVSVDENPWYQGAWSQYGAASNTAVDWNETIDIQTINPNVSSTTIEYASPSTFHVSEFGSDQPDQVSPWNIDVPHQDALNGDIFGIALNMETQVGTARLAREIPCGAIREQDGKWSVDTSITLHDSHTDSIPVGLPFVPAQ